MDGLILLFLMVLGAIVLMPIFALRNASVALHRAKKLEARVDELEAARRLLSASLRRTEQEVTALRSAAAEHSPAEPPSVTGEATPTAAAAPASAAAPAPASAAAAAPPAAAAAAAPSAAAAAPPSAAAAALFPPPPTRSKPVFEWERWVGVRGAAVLGAIVLALAAMSFFRYAVEHSLVAPPVRVIVGTLTGLACLVAGERLRQRFASTANALSGGGLVILYAAFWAARVLYELVGMEVAFALMALTTAAGCLLAVRYGSLVIAVLGLAGGFATPLLLSTGSDRPLGLFGYILLLDVGFLLVARKRGWGVLMGLALAGTLFIEGLWIVLRMGVERSWLGVGIVVLFSMVFAIAAARPAGNQRAAWLRNQAAALLLPFGLALYFASQARLGMHFAPVAVLLGLLSFGAGWVARRSPEAGWMPLSAAVACVTISGVWLYSAELTAAAWEPALAIAGLAAVFHAGAELARGEPRAARAAAVAELGLFGLAGWAAVHGSASAVLWPWLASWVLLCAAVALLSRFEGRGQLIVAAAAWLALALSSFREAHFTDPELLALPSHFALELALGLAFSTLSFVRGLRTDHLAALTLPALLLVWRALSGWRWHLSNESPSHVLALGSAAALGALGLFAATRTRDARLLLAAAVPLAAAQHVVASALISDANAARGVLAELSLSMLLVALWPLGVHARLAHQRFAFYTSALAAPLWFLALQSAYEASFGSGAIGLLPLALGALSLAILTYARGRAALAPGVQKSALAWYAAVALGFVSVAIPLQLDRQWITIGWALESAAVLYLFRRLDHAGLKWLGLGLAFLVTVRLVLNPSVLDYHQRGAMPFFNWLLYTYGVPALALAAGARALADIELSRLRPIEMQIQSARPVGTIGLVFAVVAIVFVWLNLSIFDAFGEGTELVVDFQRRPTRDLALSLAWAAYAGVLLGFGMSKSSRGLRWLSLALFILTIAKVFLYDLAELEDLYQVASLLGLSISLIAVSLAYQRFVFKKAAEEAP